MKILYAIQGTGNGHLCRAMEILPVLKRYAEVDVLVSGIQSDIELGQKISFKLHGISFIFGKRGGVDLFKSWKKNNLRTIVREIRSVPVQHYDLVINDFEPITAWACVFRKVRCISVSHQAALHSSKIPRPRHRDWFGSLILRYYAPCLEKYGFHFERYDKHIFTPIIRKEIRNIEVSTRNHYTVYLPAYSDQKIIGLLIRFPDVQWQVFSKHSKKNYFIANVQVNTLSLTKFINSMASSKGVLCGAGFETPAEALYLGKKLLVVPMKSQYEQHFNAASLEQMNVPVISSLKQRNFSQIRNWIDTDRHIEVNYPDETDQIVRELITDFSEEHAFRTVPSWSSQLWKASSLSSQ